MKIEIMTEGTQLKGVNFSHADTKQDREFVERILTEVLGGENPVIAVGNELAKDVETIEIIGEVKDVKPTEDKTEIVSEITNDDLGFVDLEETDDALVRAFLVGYYVDENGLATDENGESIGEKIPGYYLREFKNRLHLYDIVDEDGEAYLPLAQGGRLYHDDGAVIDLATAEIHKCQPINSLFAILTGMPTVKIFKDTTGIDWKKHSYAIGKAILETRDLSRTFYCDPLYAQPIMVHKIQDYEDWAKLALETIDRQVVNDHHAVASAYLLREADVEILAEILDPQAWKTIFKRSNPSKVASEIIAPAGRKIRQLLKSNRTKTEAWQKLGKVMDSWENFQAEYPSISI